MSNGVAVQAAKTETKPLLAQIREARSSRHESASKAAQEYYASQAAKILTLVNSGNLAARLDISIWAQSVALQSLDPETATAIASSLSSFDPQAIVAVHDDNNGLAHVTVCEDDRHVFSRNTIAAFTNGDVITKIGPASKEP